MYSFHIQPYSSLRSQNNGPRHRFQRGDSLPIQRKLKILYQQRQSHFALHLPKSGTWNTWTLISAQHTASSYMPMQFLGPSPKGRYEYAGMFPLFSSLKRSGSNFSGSGKYSGSWWSPNTGIKILHPFSILNPASSMKQSWVQFLVRADIGGYFLNASSRRAERMFEFIYSIPLSICNIDKLKYVFNIEVLFLATATKFTKKLKT